MASDIATLGIKVKATGIEKTTKSLRKLERQSDKTAVSSKKLGKGFSVLKSAAVALAGSFAIRGFLQTAGAFESMAVSLETVTGSAEKANLAMAGITKFAQDTPFQVREITDAFIKLKALGISPTEESLRSFGNTSSAMGKSLNQFIEAVADASNSEFERLLEFGIKAKKEGDRVKFIFQGITTDIGNNSKEITKFLEEIGTKNFGGAMIKQMDTINGKVSNLGDSWDAFIVSYSKGGGGQASKGILSLAVSAVNSLTDGMNALPSIFTAGIAQVDIFFIKFAEKAKLASLYVKALWTTGDELKLRRAEIKAAAESEVNIARETAAQIIAINLEKINAGGSITKGGEKTPEEKAAMAQANADKLFEIESEQLFRQIDLDDEKLTAQLNYDERIKEQKQKIAQEKLDIEESYYSRLFDLESGSMRASEKFAKSIRDNDVKGALKSGSLMLANAAKTSKEAFQLQKAASLAQAIVELPAAVISSFRNGGGYPFGLIPAALMAAAGAKQISAIASTSFGSKSSGVSVGGGSSSPSIPVASGLPGGATAQVDGSERRQSVNITLNGAGYSPDDVRELIEKINEEIGDGSVLVAA